MATLLKKKQKTPPDAIAPPSKPTEERPVPGAESKKQTNDSYLAFTIQRRHDGVTFLFELVALRVEKGAVFEIRRDAGTTREIVESKIFRDLSEITF